MGNQPVEIKIFSESGDVPEYESAGASGMDLHYHGKDVMIGAHSTMLLPTGLHVQIPPGYEIQIRSRSGLAAKHNISVLNSPGTIDSDFRGNISVILFNHASFAFEVKSDMRIAQAVLSKVPVIHWNQVMNLNELSKTERQGGGFGSTGNE